MRPYMWCLLGTKAQPHFLIQNRFFSERDSSRPTKKRLNKTRSQAECGLASDPLNRKKIAPCHTGFEMTVTANTAHTEHAYTITRQGPSHAHLPAVATALHPLPAALGRKHSGDQQLPSRIPLGPELQRRFAQRVAGGSTRSLTSIWTPNAIHGRRSTTSLNGLSLFISRANRIWWCWGDDNAINYLANEIASLGTPVVFLGMNENPPPQGLCRPPQDHRGAGTPPCSSATSAK